MKVSKSSSDAIGDKKEGTEGNATASAKDESNVATDAKMPASETAPAASNTK